MKTLALITAVLSFVMLTGCSGKKSSSSDALKELEAKWTPAVGKATKSEFVENYGNAQWCKPDENSGEETCRFYLKKGTKWLGDAKDRAHIDQGDDVVANFDNAGILQSFKAKAQR